jgi:hypothetical protein
MRAPRSAEAKGEAEKRQEDSCARGMAEVPVGAVREDLVIGVDRDVDQKSRRNEKTAHHFSEPGDDHAQAGPETGAGSATRPTPNALRTNAQVIEADPTLRSLRVPASRLGGAGTPHDDRTISDATQRRSGRSGRRGTSV